MTELSKLLKEAKPLYIERMRAKKRMQKTLLSLFMVFTVFVSGFSGYALKSSNIEYIAGTDTITTDSYFPLDDYGLITVVY